MNNGHRSTRRRVVITGLGAVTPLGLTANDFWQGLVEGRSGIGPMTLCDASEFPSRIAGEVKGFDPKDYISSKEVRRLARFSQFGIAASGMAIEDAGLDLSKEAPERVGVLLGNGSGSFPDIDAQMKVLVEKGGMRIAPFFMPTALPNMAAAQISRTFGLRGYNNTVCTACAAASQAIGDAVEVIRRGAADVMLAGGAEAGISQLGLAGFCVMRALSTRNEEPERASRPFEAGRDGFVPAEGAGIVVLESLEHAIDRGAAILAEMVGYGASADAYHPVQPEENGQGAALAICSAMQDAGIAPEDVDYINAHGTSTLLNDASETAAIKLALGEAAYRVPISSTKSMIGHALGAAGGLEAVACVKTINESLIHPTINYETPDPSCDLDYAPNAARRQNVDIALSNSFGFGGQNVCLVFRKFAE